MSQPEPRVLPHPNYRDADAELYWHREREYKDPEGKIHSPFCACFSGPPDELKKMSDCDCGAHKPKRWSEVTS